MSGQAVSCHFRRLSFAYFSSLSTSLCLFSPLPPLSNKTPHLSSVCVEYLSLAPQEAPGLSPTSPWRPESYQWCKLPPSILSITCLCWSTSVNFSSNFLIILAVSHCILSRLDRSLSDPYANWPVLSLYKAECFSRSNNSICLSQAFYPHTQILESCELILSPYSLHPWPTVVFVQYNLL